MSSKLMDILEAELIGTPAQKAALKLADFNSASLTNEEADRFINQVVDESALLKAVRVHRTNSPSGDLSKLNITGPVTEKATENTDSGNTYKPANAVVSYATAKTRSAIDITGEVQEDTIEGGGAQSTIMSAMISQIANDMEMLSIEGDTSIAGATASDRLLKSNNGWHTLTGSTSGVNRVDAGGLRASYRLFVEMMRAMPTKWARDLNKLRWVMSKKSEIDLSEEWGGRVTDLGDTLRQTGALPPILGVAPLVVTLLPTDLTIDGTSGDTGSFIWLMDPTNFIYVVQRELTVEWERVPRSDTDQGTVHMRTDFIIEEEDAIVKAYNVNTDTAVALYS